MKSAVAGPEGNPAKSQRQANRKAPGPGSREASGPGSRETSGQANRKASGPGCGEASGPANRKAPGPGSREASGRANRKAPGDKTPKGLLKVLKWIVILLIPLNLLILILSFAFPGRLGCIDAYQVAVQQLIVHQLDKVRPNKLLHGAGADKYTAAAIQFRELTPYLDSIIPGTLFFSEHGRRVSNLFIKSDWKHCGIFLGTLQQVEQHWGEEDALVEFLRPFYKRKDEYLVFDSSYDLGVAIHSIRDMAGLNTISTLRKLLLFELTRDSTAWNLALSDNTKHLGKQYDYAFVADHDEAFYCSEFLVKVLPLKATFFSPSATIAGRPLLLPSDLVDAILDKGIPSGIFRYKGCITKNGGNNIIQDLQQDSTGLQQDSPAFQQRDPHGSH